jgi:hypothetical protein
MKKPLPVSHVTLLNLLGNSKKKTSEVQASDVRRGDHNNDTNAAHDGSAEDRPSSVEIGRDWAGEERPNEGAESHERTDELLYEGCQVPSDGGCRILDTIDLQETDHSLKSTDEREIKTILEGGHSNDGADEDRLPVVP